MPIPSPIKWACTCHSFCLPKSRTMFLTTWFLCASTSSAAIVTGVQASSTWIKKCLFSFMNTKHMLKLIRKRQSLSFVLVSQLGASPRWSSKHTLQATIDAASCMPGWTKRLQLHEWRRCWHRLSWRCQTMSSPVLFGTVSDDTWWHWSCNPGAWVGGEAHPGMMYLPLPACRPLLY